MFTLYIDDSGTDPKQHVAIATALRMPAIQIPALEQEWEKFTKKEEFTYYHTSEFVAKNAKSEFANWSDEKQARVFKRVRQIAKKYGARALSIAVNKKDYDDLMPSEFRPYFGNYHYTWAIRQLVSFVGKWHETSNGIPFEFIFQWMGGPNDPRRVEIETVMQQAQWLAEQNGVLGSYSNYSFQKSQGIPGLQCVDAISWVSYRYALHVFNKAPLSKLADESWRDFGGPQAEEGWLMAFTILRDKLKKSIDKSLETGKSKEFFKQWVEYKSKKL